MPLTNMVAVGVITSSHGVSGHIKIRTEDFSVEIEKGTWCFVEIQKKPVPFFVEDGWGGDGFLILKLKGVDSPEEIGFFRSKILLLSRADLKIKDEEVEEITGPRLWMGFDVLNEEDVRIGAITRVIDNSGQWLLELDNGSSNEILVPYHTDLLIHKDEQKGLVKLQIPEGLLDL